MALETLKDIQAIDGFAVKRAYWSQSPDGYIEINDRDNAICFKIQNGPIGEVGINGCQVDTIIETALLIVQGLNKKFPCRENSITITKLEEALHRLRDRKKDRTDRGVEGKSAA